MKKKVWALVMACALSASLIGCGAGADMANEETADEAASDTEDEAADEDTSEVGEGIIGLVDDTLAEDEDALIAAYADKFEQIEYTDDESGLSVTYNLFLPEDYDENGSYPMVVFIADSSCAGDDATKSLTQGRGALVWASDEWQAVNPSVVLVPSYPETILDDQAGYSTTGYVEMTKGLIEAVASEYAVDSSRIYGTGQSMGCMTTLILASEYPDLYAACMFVDGQWDVTTLSSLEDQAFVYFAAEDDENAYKGMQEVMAMFDNDAAEYAYAQWDGGWTPEELTAAAQELFAAGNTANFVSWKTGTIEAASMGGGMGGGHADNDDDGDAAENAAGGGMKPDDVGHDAPEGGAPDGDGMEQGSMQGGMGGDGQGEGGDDRMQSVMYHMASFDYAYNCIAAMEWLFSN